MGHEGDIQPPQALSEMDGFGGHAVGDATVVFRSRSRSQSRGRTKRLATESSPHKPRPTTLGQSSRTRRRSLIRDTGAQHSVPAAPDTLATLDSWTAPDLIASSERAAAVAKCLCHTETAQEAAALVHKRLQALAHYGSQRSVRQHPRHAIRVIPECGHFDLLFGHVNCFADVLEWLQAHD